MYAFSTFPFLIISAVMFAFTVVAIFLNWAAKQRLIGNETFQRYSAVASIVGGVASIIGVIFAIIPVGLTLKSPIPPTSTLPLSTITSTPGIGVGILWWDLLDASGQIVDSGRTKILSSDIEIKKRIASDGRTVYDKSVPINGSFRLRTMSELTNTKPDWNQNNSFCIPLMLEKTDQDLSSFEVLFLKDENIAYNFMGDGFMSYDLAYSYEHGSWEISHIRCETDINIRAYLTDQNKETDFTKPTWTLVLKESSYINWLW